VIVKLMFGATLMFAGVVIGATGFVDRDGLRVAYGAIVLLAGAWLAGRATR
jgi:hypothetical protein